MPRRRSRDSRWHAGRHWSGEVIAGPRSHEQLSPAWGGHANANLSVSASAKTDRGIAKGVLVTDVDGNLPADADDLRVRRWEIGIASGLVGKFLEDFRVLINAILVK